MFSGLVVAAPAMAVGSAVATAACGGLDAVPGRPDAGGGTDAACMAPAAAMVPGSVSAAGSKAARKLPEPGSAAVSVAGALLDVTVMPMPAMAIVTNTVTRASLILR